MDKRVDSPQFLPEETPEERALHERAEQVRTFSESPGKGAILSLLEDLLTAAYTDLGAAPLEQLPVIQGRIQGIQSVTQAIADSQAHALRVTKGLIEQARLESEQRLEIERKSSPRNLAREYHTQGM